MRASDIAFCIALLVASCCGVQDDYLQAAREACLRSGAFLDCVKYKAANLVHRIATTPRSFDLGPLRLVGIAKSNSSASQEEEKPYVSRAAAYNAAEPEPMQLLRYGLRQAQLFMTSHGLSLPLTSLGSTSGAHLVYDDSTATNSVGEEGRGRGGNLIVPLMIIAKLMSVKALLIPTLLSIAAIKKFIIVAVMLLPTILHKLKICKIVPHSVHYTPHNTHSHEFHDDYLPHHESHHHAHQRMGWLRSLRK